jgi:hypothetical protein
LPAIRRSSFGTFAATEPDIFINRFKYAYFSCHDGKFLNNIWCSLPELWGSGVRNPGMFCVTSSKLANGHGSGEMGKPSSRQGFSLFELIQV